MPDLVEMMTVKDVAALLRLKPVTVYKMAQKGTIPAFRVGRSWRFRRFLVEEWRRDRPPRPGKAGDDWLESL